MGERRLGLLDAAMGRHQGGDRVSVLRHLVEEIRQLVLGDMAFERGDGTAEGRVGVGEAAQEDAGAGPRNQFSRRARFEDGKARGHIGLEGEKPQQALAEAVNGEDLQAARRFDRLGEEPARRPQVSARRRRAADVLDPGRECRVVEAGPVGEVTKNAVLHVRGGGLGEGQAQEPRGTGAGKQQPDDAAREHEGLARSGIGRDPCRRTGRRGLALR